MQSGKRKDFAPVNLRYLLLVYDGLAEYQFFHLRNPER